MQKLNKGELITWLVAFLICLLFFALGSIRQNKIDNNGNTIFRDSDSIFTTTDGQ